MKAVIWIVIVIIIAIILWMWLGGDDTTAPADTTEQTEEVAGDSTIMPVSETDTTGVEMVAEADAAATTE